MHRARRRRRAGDEARAHELTLAAMGVGSLKGDGDRDDALREVVRVGGGHGTSIGSRRTDR